ncbi:MAG: DsrE family protein [Bryobacteraceae bacterium]|nr:DsrE family protein [Bryobacteraceae bacterium]
MKVLLRRVQLLLALGLLFAAAAGLKAAETRDGVFIHISHGADDPHRLLMALNMANMMSADHPVVIYFDIKAVEAVLKESKDIQFAHFPSSKTQLAELAKRGVTMMACPGCLKVAGKTASDLASGVQVADKAKFFSFTSGRIITLDY